MLKGFKKPGLPWLIAIAAILLVLFIPGTAQADMGPKPELIINVVNPPEGEYYLDLLIQKSYHDFNLNDLEKYDPDKIALLADYDEDGWTAALVTGTGVPLYGDLIGEKTDIGMKHTFGYLGVPDDFKIIIVTPDNRLKVSEPIHRSTLKTVMTYDYETGEVKLESKGVSYIKQFIYTFISTLVLEGLLLLIFGFPFKKNWITVLWVNLATQLLLTVVTGFAFSVGGILLAILFFLPTEIVVIGVEIPLYYKFLTGRSAARRIGYAITANAISAVAGILVMFFQYGSGM